MRDRDNNGMTWKEDVTLILDWTGCGSYKTAENHFKYFVRNGKMPELKKGGRVFIAQKTTMKRGQITVEQQIWWHCVIECIWEEQAWLNLPSVLWHSIRAHFMCIINETSAMASEGTVKIIGDADQKKHQKNMDDNHDSITIVRVVMLQV
jgi:hypothetical protein